MTLTAAERTRRYKERHPERVRDSNRRYRVRVAEREAPRDRERQRAIREQVRLAVIVALGGKCAECGFSDVRALQIDHVNGGGYDEIVNVFKLNVVRYQRHVLANAASGKYQLLCANHNVIKEWERRRASRVA